MGKSQGASQPQNNQQQNTESPSVDTSSEYVSSLPSTGSNIPFGESQFNSNFDYEGDEEDELSKPGPAG
jgi:hypothetical protein